MQRLEFGKFISFNKENLKERLRLLSSTIYYYGLQDNQLHDKLDEIEWELSLLKAKKQTELRTKYNRIRKANTETSLKDMIKNDSEVMKLEKERIDLNKTIRRSKLRMAILSDLKETMINYGHFVRKEISSSRNKE